MGHVLPPDDGGLPPQPDNRTFSPRDVDLTQAYNDYIRYVYPADKLRDERRKNYNIIVERDSKNPNIRARNKAGQFAKPYQLRYGAVGSEAYKSRFVTRRISIDAKVLERAIERDHEIRRLKAILAVPEKERSRVAGAAICNKELPAIRAEMDSLQLEIELVVENLCQLDMRMRKLMGKADRIVQRSKCVRIPTEKQLKKELDKEICRVTEGLKRSQLSKDHVEIRRMHGFWGYIKKKYPEKYYQLTGET